MLFLCTCILSVYIVPGIFHNFSNIVVHPDHNLIFLLEIYSCTEVLIYSPHGYCERGILAIPLIQFINNAINHLGINIWYLNIINMPQYGALVPIYF